MTGKVGLLARIKWVATRGLATRCARHHGRRTPRAHGAWSMLLACGGGKPSLAATRSCGSVPDPLPDCAAGGGPSRGPATSTPTPPLRPGSSPASSGRARDAATPDKTIGTLSHPGRRVFRTGEHCRTTARPPLPRPRAMRPPPLPATQPLAFVALSVRTVVAGRRIRAAGRCGDRFCGEARAPIAGRRCRARCGWRAGLGAGDASPSPAQPLRRHGRT